MVSTAERSPQDLRESKMDILTAELCNEVKGEISDDLPTVRDVNMICTGFTSGLRSSCWVSKYNVVRNETGFVPFRSIRVLYTWKCSLL